MMHPDPITRPDRIYFKQILSFLKYYQLLNIILLELKQYIIMFKLVEEIIDYHYSKKLCE